MAAVEKEDPEQVRAAQILVNLRDRKLRKWPEWVPMQQPPPGTVAAAEMMMMPPSREASSSAGTLAARVVPPLRRRPEQVSMQSGQASFSLAGTVPAGVLAQWPKAKRSGSRGDTSKDLPPEQGHAAAAKGSGAPRSSEQERCAEMPAQGPVVAALCYAAVAGSGPSTSAAPANKEPMKTPSPDTPLDYGSGAPSSADDAAPAPARTQAKRKGTGDDDEGCSSPAKRGPVVAQEEEKPMAISAEPSVQNEARASGSKAAPRPFDFDLNLLPCALDEDDDGCPDTT